MNTSVLALLVVALAAANIPFFTNRVMLVIPVKTEYKALGWHVLEMVIWYFVVGFLGRLLEQKTGVAHPQHWEFYAVTASMFIVLAFPGFVYRYLWRR
ncbi:DUF2818 family protein [Sulfuriferula nivalis]|uniref:Membrane protein n=1 Tax=Sulfuriferula nivalis TaxID=2675298 RepID=A0A809RJP4_9PROT|nr:DUF2818 family protein [Sulfuriferula nivalis]BBP01806.1 membrane protein [Sulfuriferula nivalis]